MERLKEKISEWTVEKRIERIKAIYADRMQRELELEDPKLFSEIQQWVKIFCNNTSISRCVDKVTFKDYVAEKIGDGYTARTYYLWSSADEVNMAAIPERCVVKSNCMGSSRNNYVIESKKEIDLGKMEKEIKSDWFDPIKLNTNSFASFYYTVEPKVIVEENLIKKGMYFREWKILCFHGNPRCIYFPERTIHDGIVNQKGAHSFYTPDWKYMDIRYSTYPSRDDVEKPEHLESMLDIAARLSAPFPFVRVDFYERPDTFFLGELTFTQGGGLKPLYPENIDKIFGKWIIEKEWKSKYLE